MFFLINSELALLFKGPNRVFKHRYLFEREMFSNILI